MPLGIVQQIKANCYSVECHSGDEFVMCSDGVDEELLETWLNENSKENYGRILEEEMTKLDTQDDATVLLAEVSKR